MGVWGFAISSNDTYGDVYGAFFDMYNDGVEVKDISQKLITQNQETINIPDDCNNFWFALAKSQWECKQINIDVLNRVKQIIETGVDIEVWRRLGANEKVINKRKIVLNNFLKEILSDRPKAKARKKKIIREPLFEKGDCLAFRFPNGNYGGAIVLEAMQGTETPYILLAVTRINQLARPVKQDFINAEVLILNFTNWDNKPDISWMIFSNKEDALLIEKIDKIEVAQEYLTKKYEFSFSRPFDIKHVERVTNQFQYEIESKRLPTKTVRIKELI